eukprot:3482190-Prymnesium_polylepis.1
MQNVSGDLLDSGAELHYTTGDAGVDRAGSLDDDEQCAGGAASCEERARAPCTALWGGVGWVGLGASAGAA